ncbi:nodulation protein NodH [Rhodovulum iodosum]|nr:nodulation protein NodH [Rhodovulum robiginosum]RSK30380.1 nodulation protein NodH [Rhodovulum robiginosum]
MPPRFDSFVIFAEMRTGSNFLEDNLNAVPGLHCYGEAFNPHFIGQKDRRSLLGITLEDRSKDPFPLLDAMKAHTEGLPGIRFFHDHDPRVLGAVISDRRCAKIVLTRNPLDSYVSRKIAAETGQWKLTNPRHRRSAQISFNPAEFETHLARLQEFQIEILHRLQVTGQTAFYIGYDDIGDVEVLNGLLRYLGAEHRLDNIVSRLKRQNPQPLAEKVKNHTEMEAALAQLDRFDLSRTPNFEPRRGPAVPSYVAAAEAPLLFLPIKGGPSDRVEAWLAALDEVAGDALARGFSQKTLRAWKRGHPGHRSFAVVSHPLTRAHRAFCRHILSTGEDSYPALRKTLAEVEGVPLPEGGPGAEYGPEAHRAAFLAFLRFLKRNLGGRTALRVDASWASQGEVLRGMAQVALPDMVLRDERLEAELAVLAAQVGLRAPDDLPEAEEPGPVHLATIYDGEIERAARDAYQRDYMSFGYRAWANA